MHFVGTVDRRWIHGPDSASFPQSAHDGVERSSTAAPAPMIQFCELQNCPYTLADLPIAAVELRPMRMEFNLTDEHGNIVELDPALVRAHRAVLFIDVVESVRLIEDDEAGFLSRWLPIVEQTRMQILPDVGGRLVKNLGDGLLLDFGDVRSAIAAAFKVRQIADSTNRGQPLQSHIQLRGVIELSDVVLDKDDIYGRGAIVLRD